MSLVQTMPEVRLCPATEDALGKAAPADIDPASVHGNIDSTYQGAFLRRRGTIPSDAFMSAAALVAAALPESHIWSRPAMAGAA